MQEQSNSGFLGTLFDFSFTRFVSVDLVRIVYIVLIILAVFVTVFTVFLSFSNGLWPGIISLILSPVLFFVMVVLARVWLEFVVVVFRIADHAREISENTESGGA